MRKAFRSFDEEGATKGRTALVICSYLSSGGVVDWCDGVTGDARHRSMVSWWQDAALSQGQETGGRVFWQWKRPAVYVTPVTLASILLGIEEKS